jgi:hypothetical protein
VRDLPDVSLFASFGPWGHAYIICWSDPSFSSDGSKPCTGAPSNWSTGFGGTSFASPIMAGIQALVNQHTRQKWGNPNYTYYQLAKTEYGASGSSACNSSNGNANWCLGSGTPQFFINSSLAVGNLYGKAPDFNGDARRDILWRYTDGTVADWVMNGGTVTANFDLGLVSPGWTIFGTGNFFGTGTSDILWRCTDSSGVVCPSGTVAIWQISGGQFSAAADVAQVSLYWKIIGTGDFFGTGKSAILWRCTDVTGAACADGAVVIWEMNGGTLVASPGLGVVPPGWTIAGLGDFNGDGKTDILWRCTDASGSACTYGGGGDLVHERRNRLFVPQCRGRPDGVDHRRHRRFLRHRQIRHPVALRGRDRGDLGDERQHGRRVSRDRCGAQPVDIGRIGPLQPQRERSWLHDHRGLPDSPTVRPGRRHRPAVAHRAISA